MELLIKLTVFAVIAAGIVGTGLGFLVKFIVEANQTSHHGDATNDVRRK
jgi:hypothetical protein